MTNTSYGNGDPVPESPPTRLTGWATPHGTQAYEQEALLRGVTLAPNAFRTLGRTGLRVSKLGYGTYRVHADVEEHVRTLMHSLLHGVNLVDTSTNYTDGGSERLVGNVLRALVESGGMARTNFVVVSKVGYAQASNYERATEREREGRPFPEMVKVDDGLWHCIHPDWLTDQLDRSLERLQLERLDVFLLHNPEYFLSHTGRENANVPLEEARKELYRRVERAFERMERFVAEGRIGFYGVSSNTFAAPMDDPEHVSLARLLACARRAAEAVLGDSEAHHFAVAQLPFNLFEAGAFVEDNTPDGKTFLELAQAAKLGILANRPLNAIVNSHLLRIAQYPYDPSSEPPLNAVAGLAAAERDIVLDLKAWRLWDTLKASSPTDLFFDVGESLKTALPRIGGRDRWFQVFEQLLAPSIIAYTRHVQKELPAEHQQAWAERMQAYQNTLQGFAFAVTNEFNRLESEAKEPLRNALVDSLDGRGDNASLSQIALNAVASVPGVTTVLCGMRRDDYALDALSILGVQNFPDPYAPFRAVARMPLVE